MVTGLEKVVILRCENVLNCPKHKRLTMRQTGIPDNCGFYLTEVYTIFISIPPICSSRKYAGIKRGWKLLTAVVKATDKNILLFEI